MLGKEKCRILKQIRQRIADENDIPYVTRECTFRGECKGTCPRCESELRYLERELALRASLGLSAAGCSPFGGRTPVGGDDLMGMMTYEPADTPEPEIELSGEVAWPEETGDLKKEGCELPAEPAPGEYEGFELTGDVAWVPEESDG